MTFQSLQAENEYTYSTDYVIIALVGTELDKEVCEAGKVYAKAEKQRFFGRKRTNNIILIYKPKSIKTF